MTTIRATARWSRMAAWIARAALLAPVALIPLLTLSFDEAWVLGGTANIALEGHFGIGTTMGSNSTGGAYTLGQVAVAGLFGRNLVAARLLVFVTLLLLVREAQRLRACLTPAPGLGPLALVALAATPGLAFFASLADGAVPALWLLLWTVRRWCFGGPRDAAWVLQVGLLAGTCAATRMNFVFLLPVLAIAAWRFRDAARPARPALLALGVAAAVVAANFVVHLLLSQRSAAEAGEFAAYATGVSDLLGNLHPNLVTMKLTSLHAALPFGLGLVTLALALVALRRSGRTARGEALFLLLGFAAVTLLAWFAVGKLLYRYFLPAVTLASVLLAPSLGIATAGTAWRVRRLVFAAALLFSGGQLAAELVRNVRYALHGDADNVIAQWSGQRATDGLFALRAKRSERAVAAFLRTLPADASLVAYGPDDLALAYLIGRPIPDAHVAGAAKATWLVVRPQHGQDFALPAAARAVCEAHGQVVFTQGLTTVWALAPTWAAARGAFAWR